MAYLETPSRILRRMDVLEAQGFDLPSLPSLPAFEDSDLHSSLSSSISPNTQQSRDGDADDVPYHSTPAPASSHATRSTMRPPPSTSSSATRFANSMQTSVTTARNGQAQPEDSFEVSQILPTHQDNESSSASIPAIHLPTTNASDFIHRAGEDMSYGDTDDRVGCPPLPLAVVVEEQHRTPESRKYDYSISLRSEPKASPITSRRGISMHRSLARTRTPSLSRTTPSPTSVSSNSTPGSAYSHGIHGMVPTAPTIEPMEFQGPQDHSVLESEEEQERSETSQAEYVSPSEILNHDVAHEVEDQSEDERRDSSPEPIVSSDEFLQSSISPSARTPFPKAFSSPTPSVKSIPTPVHIAGCKDMCAEETPIPTRNPDQVPLDLVTPYSRRRSFLLSLVHSTTRPRMKFPTPHPRAAATPSTRPHPLSQAWTPYPAPSHLTSESTSNPSSGPSLSPNDRLSFISTASSHDLTVHPRANASFDPITGSKGAGRFNAVKLNTYLHSLNRRLQEENELLTGRLKIHGEEVEVAKAIQVLEVPERQGVREVEEDMLQEMEAMQDELGRCEQAKAAMTAEITTLRRELNVLKDEKGAVNRDLRYEQEERQKDKERWKTRMVELQGGVEGVIKELERRLEEAERAANDKAAVEDKARKLECRCATTQDELDVMSARAQKAEAALASSSDLGAEIKQANERTARYREEARTVNERAYDLEIRLRDAERKEEATRVSLEAQLAEVDVELRRSLEAQQSAEAHALELEADVKAAEYDIDKLEMQLTTLRQLAADLRSEKGGLHSENNKLAQEVAYAAEAVRQMEEALEESEGRMISDGEELASLRARISHLEKELDSQREPSKCSTIPAPEMSVSRNTEQERLETELDNAHRKIAQLNYLLSESPSRKAIEKAKNTRIELLERERDELSERVRLLQSVRSPSRNPNQTNGPTPSRQAMVFNSPITPGAALKDYSWLQANNTVPNASPLVAQIERLQQVLTLANDSIDAKVDKLGEAGIDIVGLTERLEDARFRIITLEEEIRQLLQREERQVQRIERARCRKCGGKFDMNNLIGTDETDQSPAKLFSTMLPSSPQSSPSMVVEVLRTALKTANLQLHTLRAQWETEKAQLLEEKAKLQDVANRLNVELGAAKNEVKQAFQMRRQDADEQATARASIEHELQMAKAVVNDLENALKDDRSRQRALSIDASVNRLRQELSTSQKLHDDCRRQLDLRVTEVEGLRQELRQHVHELERLELEKDKAQAGRSETVKILASLESDVRRIQDDAEALGRDLHELKKERNGHKDELVKSDRVQKQLCTQVRVANERLETQREKTDKAISDLEHHVCDPDQEGITRLEMQHRNECKGLMVQIRYLKAKFQRESLFRADLAYQKHYLLDILAGFEKSEEQILAAVARIGFPAQSPPMRRRHTLRVVGVAALFIIKAKRTSEIWREQWEPRSAITAALQEVRSRRATRSIGHI